MSITPINEAEAIIDPFWDPQLSELSEWTIEPGEAHGLFVRQNWCWVNFGWARRPAQGPALRMWRKFGLSCADYDRLVLSVMAPLNSVVRMTAETDRGVRQAESPPAGRLKREITLPLEGATRLEAVTLEVEAGTDGIAEGWFNWLGLQHSGRLAQKLHAQANRHFCWDRHLKPESHVPRFEPSYGLLLNAAELAALRQQHEALTAAGNPSPFAAIAEHARTQTPESLINDFVNLVGDTRYNRERDHGRHILYHGLNAGLAGHLLRDPSLLRLAARYALSLGYCGRWDDGFICRFPGGTFEHRCFVQSLCAYEVAGILDLAGECFTEVGRDFLLRRLAEEAIGTIQYNTWKYEYIFQCNQLAWFSPGRILALGVLLQRWSRVRPYLDLAYRELCENLENTILPDGGYVEGPLYFCCVGRYAGLGLYHYARAMGRAMADVIPPVMRRTDTFAAALISTDEGIDMIPICDAFPRHPILSQAMMASLLPKSAWVRMLHKSIARNGGWPIREEVDDPYVPLLTDAAIAWSLAEGVPTVSGNLPAWVVLPDMGPMASHRRLGEYDVKIFIQGNRAGAGHTHEDKGSFVLEFAGETFAMDPGSCDYSHPLASILKNAERHNMLVPWGTAERPAPQCPLPRDVKPVGQGDAVSFHVEMDLTPGWERYYRRWHRTWDSPAPDCLTITDEYELVAGEGVEFYWQTRLPVSVDGSRAMVSGRRGTVVIEAPAGLGWRVDELPLLDGIQRRLVLRCHGPAGRLTVRVRLLTEKPG